MYVLENVHNQVYAGARHAMRQRGGGVGADSTSDLNATRKLALITTGLIEGN